MSNPAINRGVDQSPLYLGRQLLFQIIQANMQSTSAQPLTRMFSGQNYRITDVVARQRSGAASVTCVGGISDGTNAWVAPTQSWVTLSSGIIVTATLAAVCNTVLGTSANNSLTLTTGSTAACLADLYIYGEDLT